MRVVGVSYKVGTSELRAMVQDPERRRIVDVKIRWFSVNDLPPSNWSDCAKAEAKQTPVVDPISQMFKRAT